MKYHELKDDFKLIADKILAEDKILDEWSEIESDDMFQEGGYIGGFDATEMEFCFSFYDNEKEYWFQLSMEDLIKYSKGEIREVEIVEADY